MIVWLLILSLLAPDMDARRRKRRRGPREPIQAYTQGYKEHKEVKEDTAVTPNKELLNKLIIPYEQGRGCLCEAVNKSNNYNCYCVSTVEKEKKITLHHLKSLKNAAEVTASIDEYFNNDNYFSLYGRKDITGAAEISNTGKSCVLSYHHCICLNNKGDKSSGFSHIDVLAQGAELNTNEAAYKVAAAACSNLNDNAYSLTFKQALFSYFPVIYAGELVDEVEKIGKVEKKDRANLIQVLKKAEKEFASDDTKDDITDVIVEISK